MSAQPVVQVEDLDVYYGTSQILFGVGLSVRQGETMALLGRNGAGKSTTMKAIMGLAPARRGRVTLSGRVVSGLKPHHIARAGLGFVPEDRQIFPDHTVEDNLVIGQKKGAQGQDEWSIRRVYDVFPLLEPLRYRIAGRLSGGEQQMLAIARTLMGNPALLLLDEPSEGLAPIIVQRIGELLRQLRGTGATVLIAEQNMHFCLGLASHATVIDKGQIVYASTIEDLKANDNIRQRYLALKRQKNSLKRRLSYAYPPPEQAECRPESHQKCCAAPVSGWFSCDHAEITMLRAASLHGRMQ
jgi:branched-chain amino acid transport system ATP-binding protein